jgi:hypothetical protein
MLSNFEELKVSGPNRESGEVGLIHPELSEGRVQRPAKSGRSLGLAICEKRKRDLDFYQK